jgi:hypothetical protein
VREVAGSNPVVPTTILLYSPERSFTERSEGIVYTLGPKGLSKGLQGFFLQIDVTEIIIHKADKPDTLVELIGSPACPPASATTSLQTAFDGYT